MTITPQGWITLAACAGELALALIALLRGSPSRLALPLALFSLDLFFWNFATLAYDVSGIAYWHWLDHATSPLSAPLAFHFVVLFVGRWKQLRRLVWLVYACFGLLGAASALAFVSGAARAFTQSAAWAAVHLGLLLPVAAVGVWCLGVHLRHSGGGEERSRGRLLLGAFVALALLGSTELLRLLGAPIPPLGNVGVLACNALMLGALRFRLFEQPLRSVLAWNALWLAALAVGAYVAIFRFRGTPLALLVLGFATLLFALATAARQLASSFALRRERVQRLATLGRFSTQMAHDLKNPLAALKGAVQYLVEEGRRRAPSASEAELLPLMLDQIERMIGIVAQYQRIAKVEPQLAPLQVNEVVREVLALQPFARKDHQVLVRADLDETIPPCLGDRQLLTAALENVVRNAFEAMPTGGELKVRTRRNGADRLVISIEDSGEGMNPRTLEQAFDDFFTTKAQGTGLGLTFARRVAEAHGGDVLLTSREGLGTVVSVEIPLRVPSI